MLRNELMLLSVLMLTWYCFSGYSDLFFLSSGLVSCIVAVCVTRRMMRVSGEGISSLYMRPFHPLYLLWLVGLFKEVILSSISVSRQVWKRNIAVEPVLTWVDTKQTTHEGVATYANSITLTPGTVCIDTSDSDNENKVLVHALQKETLDDLETGIMDVGVHLGLGITNVKSAKGDSK